MDRRESVLALSVVPIKNISLVLHFLQCWHGRRKERSLPGCLLRCLVHRSFATYLSRKVPEHKLCQFRRLKGHGPDCRHDVSVGPRSGLRSLPKQVDAE